MRAIGIFIKVNEGYLFQSNASDAAVLYHLAKITGDCGARLAIN